MITSCPKVTFCLKIDLYQLFFKFLLSELQLSLRSSFYNHPVSLLLFQPSQPTCPVHQLALVVVACFPPSTNFPPGPGKVSAGKTGGTTGWWCMQIMPSNIVGKKLRKIIHKHTHTHTNAVLRKRQWKKKNEEILNIAQRTIVGWFGWGVGKNKVCHDGRGGRKAQHSSRPSRRRRRRHRALSRVDLFFPDFPIHVVHFIAAGEDDEDPGFAAKACFALQRRDRLRQLVGQSQGRVRYCGLG